MTPVWGIEKKYKGTVFVPIVSVPAYAKLNRSDVITKVIALSTTTSMANAAEAINELNKEYVGKRYWVWCEEKK